MAEQTRETFRFRTASMPSSSKTTPASAVSLAVAFPRFRALEALSKKPGMTSMTRFEGMGFPTVLSDLP